MRNSRTLLVKTHPVLYIQLLPHRAQPLHLSFQCRRPDHPVAGSEGFDLRICMVDSTKLRAELLSVFSLPKKEVLWPTAFGYF